MPASAGPTKPCFDCGTLFWAYALKCPNCARVRWEESSIYEHRPLIRVGGPENNCVESFEGKGWFTNEDTGERIPEDDFRRLRAACQSRAVVGQAEEEPDLNPPETKPSSVDETKAGEGRSAPGKKIGRRADTDPKRDKQIYDAWQTRQHHTHRALATALGLELSDVKRAIDRHRKREKGAGKTAQEKPSQED